MAIEYEARTGIDAMSLSPLQLEMRMRVLDDFDRRKRIEMAAAVATAMSGDEKAWQNLSR